MAEEEKAQSVTPSWHAEHTPDVPAVIMAASGEVTTFAELEDRSTRFAQALRARGVPTGAHIAVLMENNRVFLEVGWAAQRAGLYYTAINSHLRSAEVQYVLDDCGAVALVSSESMLDVVAELDLARIGVRIAGVGTLPGFERYDDVLASVEAAPDLDESEGREMLYSSGTTGRPKGSASRCRARRTEIPSAQPVQLAQALSLFGSVRARCTCPRHRCTTPRRSCTRWRCTASGRRSW